MCVFCILFCFRESVLFAGSLCFFEFDNLAFFLRFSVTARARHLVRFFTSLRKIFLVSAADPFKCGPLMCTHSGKECAGKLLALGDSLLRNQDSGALRLLGIASGTNRFNFLKV